MRIESGELWLLVRAGGQLYALSLEHVEETMRPQPVRAISCVPSFVNGLAVIRGGPVPVVDAAAVLGVGHSSPSPSAARFVALRITLGRRVALAVDEVVGVRRIRGRELEDLPPLMTPAQQQIVSSVGILDRELVMVLRAGKLVPENVWSSIAAETAR